MEAPGLEETRTPRSGICTFVTQCNLEDLAVISTCRENVTTSLFSMGPEKVGELTYIPTYLV